MAKQIQFKVSKRGVEPVVANFSAPENLEDPRWKELGFEPQDIHEAALAATIVTIQNAARAEFDEGGKGAAGVQGAVDEWKRGAKRTRRSGSRGPSAKPIDADTVKKGKFSKEQLEILRAAGVSFAEEGAAS